MAVAYNEPYLCSLTGFMQGEASPSMKGKESKGAPRGEGKQRGDLCVQVMSLSSKIGSLWVRDLQRTAWRLLQPQVFSYRKLAYVGCSLWDKQSRLSLNN